MKYTTVLILLTVALSVLLLAGCGQKGPLYLPSSEPAPAATADTPNQSSVPDVPTATDATSSEP